MPPLFICLLASQRRAEKRGRVERSPGGVADLEVEVGTGRGAVAAGHAAAGSDGLATSDLGAVAEPLVRLGEVGVERPDGRAPRGRSVLDLDDEPVSGSATDGADDARGHGPNGSAERDC
ncbi:MAG: hypothetical protein AAGI91_09995 [Bacteroidota bacterium]